MNKNSLKIAVSQFPISEDIKRNMRFMTRHILLASKKQANMIHFPETSLSGYDIIDLEKNWGILAEAIKDIKLLARQEKIHVVFGTYHKNTKNIKPYNCTYLISKDGELVGKYIKSKLYGAENDKFQAKDNILVHEINGIKCGFLICYESSFPKLFEHYRELGVKLLFLSYYNSKSLKPKNSMDELMKSQFVARATDNQMYISGSNSSAKYSRMPSSFVRPDGKLTQLKRHKPGILICNYPGDPLGWTYDNRI
jgi:predicted amidohydrolase